MGSATIRATIYLDPELHKALRFKAVETSQSVSKLVNNAVKVSLAEDAEDLVVFDERVKEPVAGYESKKNRLKMRTDVVINDDLMTLALKVSGLKTKKDVIEEGLKLLVQMKGHKEIKQYRGKLKWSGNLDEMRNDR